VKLSVSTPLLLLGAFLVSGCGQSVSQQSATQENAWAKNSSSVVYGEDSRAEISGAKDEQLRKTFLASPAVFTTKNLVAKQNAFRLQGRILGEKKQLCPGERFAEQLSAARCTSVLISKKIILTAGHCVSDQLKCDATSFVFGWQGKANQVERASVYGCKRWISGASSDGSLQGKDFAIVELDREVKDVEPVTIDFSALQAGEQIFTIGYPNGISAKMSEGKITFSSEFLANATAEIDGFTGNSGGGIFNSEHQLRGIYAYGELDYELDAKRNCHVVKKCESGKCMEETLLQLGAIRAEIEAALQ
jgi:hypothetical protein